MTKQNRIDPTTPDMKAELLARLKDVVPEAFSDGQLDLERLAELAGDTVVSGPERYGLTWPGKRDAIAMLQAPSRATLVAERNSSVNFDDARHVFIEGENLEVLKLLYKSYFGRVKLIYIDPPYNTATDLIYSDDFSDPLAAYLHQTGQMTDAGDMTTSAPEKVGRKHSNWLSMMYPRLSLARQFLAEDGAIFVSINDIEARNLRLIMDEVFGEENFVAQIVWQRSKKGDSKLIAVVHEYVLVYARNKVAAIESGKWRQKKEGVDEVLAHYKSLCKLLKDNHSAIEVGMREWFTSLPADDPSKAHKHYRCSDKTGLYFPADFAGPDDGRKSRPRYDILHPVTGKPVKKPSTGWRWDEARTKRALAVSPPLIHFGVDETTIPCRKSYLENVSQEPFTSVFYRDGRAATLQVEQLLCDGAFDFPKNTDVLGSFLEIVGDDEAIVLDFFAGSGSTAQAVFERNAADNGRRRYILVQLPEAIEPPKVLDDGTTISTIAEASRERVKRAIATTPAYAEEGFRAFRLTASNVRRWSGIKDATPEDYIQQMDAFADTLLPGWKAEDVIWEVALREGFPLTANITPIGDASQPKFWRVSDDEQGKAFTICLADHIELESVKALGLGKSDMFVCRDTALDDTVAANLALQSTLKVL
jgi:adenine-specific DNA-methyltransferase